MGRKYKLLAVDLDGTLLNEEKIVTEKNLEAIRKCLDNGIKVVISSGRAMEDMKDYTDIVGIDGYCSAAHGSTIFNAKEMKIIEETFLENEIAKKVIKEIENIEDISILVFTKGLTYTSNMSDYLKLFVSDKTIHIEVIESLELIQDKITKILIRGKRNHLENIKEKMSFLDKDCKIFFTEENLLEFMSLSVNKGHSLQEISKLYNIPIEETVSVGDNYNDLEMIEAAGVGVAMVNAVDELKEKADYVTKNTNNEDAIAEVINKYFFGEE